MDSLPDTILEKMFNYFPLCERILSLDLVCNRWSNLMPFSNEIDCQRISSGSRKRNLCKNRLVISRFFSYSRKVPNVDSEFDYLNALLTHAGDRMGDDLTEMTFSPAKSFYTQ